MSAPTSPPRSRYLRIRLLYLARALWATREALEAFLPAELASTIARLATEARLADLRAPRSGSLRRQLAEYIRYARAPASGI